jgi:hypothetical protein
MVETSKQKKKDEMKQFLITKLKQLIVSEPTIITQKIFGARMFGARGEQNLINQLNQIQQ